MRRRPRNTSFRDRTRRRSRRSCSGRLGRECTRHRNTPALRGTCTSRSNSLPQRRRRTRFRMRRSWRYSPADSRIGHRTWFGRPGRRMRRRYTAERPHTQWHTRRSLPGQTEDRRTRCCSLSGRRRMPDTQEPLKQFGVAPPQATPHSPQFVAFVPRFTQRAPQAVRGAQLNTSGAVPLSRMVEPVASATRAASAAAPGMVWPAFRGVGACVTLESAIERDTGCTNRCVGQTSIGEGTVGHRSVHYSGVDRRDSVGRRAVRARRVEQAAAAGSASAVRGDASPAAREGRAKAKRHAIRQENNSISPHEPHPITKSASPPTRGVKQL